METFYSDCDCDPQNILCFLCCSMSLGWPWAFLWVFSGPEAEVGRSPLRRAHPTPLFISCPSPSLAFVSYSGFREWGCGIPQSQTSLTPLDWTS